MIEPLKDFYNNSYTLPIKNRLVMLCALEEAIKYYQKEIYIALWRDLSKSKEEVYLTELSLLYKELGYFKANIKRWASVKRIASPLFMFPSVSRVVNIPYGVTLILSPWNYPILLLFQPLIAALGAGNTALLKPSPKCPFTTDICVKIINMFNNIVIKKLNLSSQSGIPVIISPVNAQKTDNFLSYKYDYIFFTGGETFGKSIAIKAANDLTPITLELGGKSPCIITPQSNLNIAAKRVIWGKLINAGQTCVAPDYILVCNSVKKELIIKLIEAINTLYPNIANNQSYGRIISKDSMERLISIINKYKEQVIYGGSYNLEDKYIEPTLIESNSLDNQETFGPILQIISYNHISEAINIINQHPSPLAFYYFGDKKEGEHIMKTIKSGGGCINDCIMHISNLLLPFGGIGASGMGAYHGEAGFQTFSHKKSYVISKKNIDINIKYPPYKYFSIIKRLLK